ncbi:hypothetical protein MKJ01_14175 [Chryseobacterium sp. SSA4.19]|uniref:hypothetical protein n=1 Tax=Chryseobacterium sp. SSA4.19 TaxID=2919915 RepID=UPI001F4DFFE2|nr:hypothetical protein [Chryseobacterium sp. SSA4.19]MCJ8154913.1 hypothetical protein [Chryseobacterium sp. SSA4.19]
MKKILVSLIIFCVMGCKKNPEKFVNDERSDSMQKETKASQTNVNTGQKESALKQINEAIVQLLKDKNYRKLADFIHPEKGVRFSMYAFVNPAEDKIFSRDEFIRYQPTKTIFTWGAMDGSGDLYKATLNDYLNKWVYSKDFATAQVSLNEFQGSGNSLNNLTKIYPKADFTENFIKGSEGNPEMDWKCLRLVFEEFKGKYYLVGIVNDQWTI